MNNERLDFTAEKFYELLRSQQKRCPLTNRELTPLSAEVELRDPNKTEGRFAMENLYIVDKDLKFLCRHLSEVEIIELCGEVIEHRGKDFGITIRRVKK